MIRVDVELPKADKTPVIHVLAFSEKVSHVAKPPYHTIDLYSEYLCLRDPTIWTVQTWKRGSKINVSSSNLKDIKTLKYQQTQYNDGQDHSKWAASDAYCFIGDLNRMESQAKRGGGGVLIHHPHMAKAFKELVLF